MQEDPLGGYSVIQVRDDGSSTYQGGSSGNDEKWLDSGCTLKPLEFADGSDEK